MRLVQLRDDALAVMKDAGLRSKEAADAKKMKLQVAIEFLQEAVRGRKSLFSSEIYDCWKAENNPIEFFSEQDLKAQITAILNKIGITIIDNMDDSLPMDKYREVNKFLFTLGKNDLYDFLCVPATASAADLSKAKTDRYGELATIKDRNKKTAADRLCSFAQELILKSPADKKNYDRYLLLKDDVWAKFEMRHKHGNTIPEEAYLDFVNTVKTKLNVSVDEANKILAVGCKVFQLTVLGGGDMDVETCPFCKKLFKKGPKSCPHCGKSFVAMCWNCGAEKPMSSGDSACPTCKATNHTRELFNKKCADIDVLKRKVPVAAGIRTIAEASQAEMTVRDVQNALLDLKNMASPVGGKSEVEKKLVAYQNELKAFVDGINKKKAEIQKVETELRSTYEKAFMEVREAAAKKQLVKATQLVNALRTKYATFEVARTQQLATEVANNFGRAQAHVSTANQLIARNAAPTMIVSYAVKALELCEDYEDAKQIIRRFPPKAVTGLRGGIVGNTVRLEWDDNLNQGVTYKVVKKVGVVPTNAGVGQTVAEGVTVKFCEDKSIISGTPYYYAVFAEQKITETFKTTSPICAARSPMTVYTDVAGVQQDLVYGGIKVSWDMPQNVKSVEVWKNKGAIAPTAPGQGVKIECDAKGFYDKTAEGDNGYLVVCNYLVNGQTVRSKGLQFVYKPFVKTSALEEVKFTTLNEGNYLFTCKAGYAGKIRLYTSDKKLPIATGQMLKYIDFNTVCKGLVPLPSTVTAEGGLSFTLAPGKIYYVYPIVSTDQLCVVSPPEMFNRAEGLQQYSHSVANGTVTVRGVMHPKATAIIATVNNEKYVEDIEKCNEKYVFKKAEFEANGKLDIKLRTNTVNYITLFPEFAEGNAVTYSKPIKLDPPIDYREAVTVYYKMTYTVSPMKKFAVTIEFEAEQAVEIPKLLLMQGFPRPLNKTAGKLTETIEPFMLKKGLFSKKYTGKQVITVLPTAGNMRFAIFPSDENSHVKLREL